MCDHCQPSQNRICNKCNDNKPLTCGFWHKHGGSRKEFRRTCKDCLNKQDRERTLQNNPEFAVFKKRITPKNPNNRVCTKCFKEFPLTIDNFYYSKKTFDTSCKSCRREHQRNRYLIEENKIIKLQSNKKWREDNAQYQKQLVDAWYRVSKGLPPDADLTYHSAPELVIKQFLEENNIKFEMEKKFIDCRDKDILPFDFYLANKNLIIEFDGKHHYQNIWGNLGLVRKHDNIKNEYCRVHNINILRIPYWEEPNMLKYITSLINHLTRSLR